MDKEPWNWGCIVSLLGCVLVWTVIVIAIVVWWDVIGDWFLIACVVTLVIATFFVVQSFVDSLIEYWRAYKDEQ